MIIELLLRGPQTEGELRSRVSRMEPLADLAALQSLLEALTPRGLVVYLSPPGQKRGVMVTHGLYPPEELEKVRHAFAASAAAGSDDDAARAGLDVASRACRRGDRAGLDQRDRPGAGRDRRPAQRLDALIAEIRDLKSALGA